MLLPTQMFRCFLVVFSILMVENVHGAIGRKKEAKRVMLLRLVPRNDKQLDFLSSLKMFKGSLKMQLWRHPDKIDQHVDIWLSQKSLKEFESLSKKYNLTYEIITKNIFDEWGKNKYSMINIEDFDLHYQRYDEIVGELQRLASVYKNVMELKSIGKSYEKNDIYLVHISKNRTASKKIIYLNCGSHAREFIAVASCKYFIRKILFDMEYNEKVKMILDNFDIVMTPLLNPDGYVFAHDRDIKDNRLWRKSRSPTSTAACYGVDLNRNFDYRWGGYGASTDPCEEVFSGPHPFSEQETLALARYLYKHRRRLISYLDIHSFGQLWMSPWGYTTSTPKHHNTHLKMMNLIKNALAKEQNITYKVGQSGSVLYQTAGDSLDWAYGRLGILHSYGVELRPSLSNKRGFRYSSKATIPTGQDLLVGVITLAQALSKGENTMQLTI